MVEANVKGAGLWNVFEVELARRTHMGTRMNMGFPEGSKCGRNAHPFVNLCLFIGLLGRPRVVDYRCKLGVEGVAIWSALWVSLAVVILSVVVVEEYLLSVYTVRAVVMGEALTESEQKEGCLRGEFQSGW